MAAPSVTYTFSDGTTIVHSEVNQNFTDIINGLTDGSEDLTISALTAQGAAVLNGAVTLGNATSDDITVNGRIASDFDPKTAASNDLGDSTQTWRALYLDNTATDGGAIYFDGTSTKFIKANAAGTDLLIDAFTTVSVDGTLQAQTDAASALGSTSVGWTALYLDNSGTDGGSIYFDGSNSSYIQSDASGGDLLIRGFTGLDLGPSEIKNFALYDEAKSASYTVTDADGVSVVYVTTGSTDRTVTLPTAADNAGRVITIKKVDSGTGIVTVDGEGSETIDGLTTRVCYFQYDFMTVQCDGSNWHIIHKNDVSIWVDFTPSWHTNWPSSPSTNDGKYRRVGKNIEINVYRVEANSDGSGGTCFLTIPNSWVVDTDDLHTGTAATGSLVGSIGIGGWYDSSGNAMQVIAAGLNSTTQIAFHELNATAAGFLAGSEFAASDTFNCKMSFPITAFD